MEMDDEDELFTSGFNATLDTASITATINVASAIVAAPIPDGSGPRTQAEEIN